MDWTWRSLLNSELWTSSIATCFRSSRSSLSCSFDDTTGSSYLIKKSGRKLAGSSCRREHKRSECGSLDFTHPLIASPLFTHVTPIQRAGTQRERARYVRTRQRTGWTRAPLYPESWRRKMLPRTHPPRNRPPRCRDELRHPWWCWAVWTVRRRVVAVGARWLSRNLPSLFISEASRILTVVVSPDWQGSEMAAQCMLDFKGRATHACCRQFRDWPSISEAESITKRSFRECEAVIDVFSKTVPWLWRSTGSEFY